MRTAAVVAVKPFSTAKQRLAGRLDPSARAALVEAMFRDVLAALLQVARIEHVIVVTPNPTIAAAARAAGATVVEDDERGYSAAALAGIRCALAAGIERVVLVPGDTPLVDSVELDTLLAEPSAPGSPPTPSVVVVPDYHGAGTNALLLAPPDVIAPAFGPGSCARHAAAARAAGARVRVAHVASLALDVDTPAELEAYRRMHLQISDGETRTRSGDTTIFRRHEQMRADSCGFWPRRGG